MIRATPGALKLFNRLKIYIVKNWTKTTDRKFYVGPHAAELHRSRKIQIKYGGKVLQLAPE